MKIFPLLLLPLTLSLPLSLHKRNAKDFFTGIGDGFKDMGKSIVGLSNVPQTEKSLDALTSSPFSTSSQIIDQKGKHCKEVGSTKCAGETTADIITFAATDGAGAAADAAGASASAVSAIKTAGFVAGSTKDAGTLTSTQQEAQQSIQEKSLEEKNDSKKEQLGEVLKNAKSITIAPAPAIKTLNDTKETQGITKAVIVDTPPPPPADGTTQYGNLNVKDDGSGNLVVSSKPGPTMLYRGAMNEPFLIGKSIVDPNAVTQLTHNTFTTSAPQDNTLKEKTLTMALPDPNARDNTPVLPDAGKGISKGLEMLGRRLITSSPAGMTIFAIHDAVSNGGLKKLGNSVGNMVKSFA